MIKLQTPLTSKDISQLHIGDEILLSGTIFTARDKAYNYLLDNNFQKIKNTVIYHAGPIMKGDGKKTMPVSVGPTTSARFLKRSLRILKKYKIKAFIGKGGMDSPEMIEALEKNKAVYLAAVGGAGVIYADAVSKVKNNYQKKLGMADSIWEFEIKDFPLVVTMDCHGNSIYHKIYQRSKSKIKKFLK